MLHYSKSRALAQTIIKPLSKDILPAGLVLNIKDIIMQSFDEGFGERPDDQLLCVDSEGRNIKIPLREYLRFKTTDESKSLYSGDSQQDTVELPDSITIIGSTDRLDQRDQKVYPLFAYNNAKQFLEAKGAMSWDELLAGGIREDNDLPCKQDYTVKVN